MNPSISLKIKVMMAVLAILIPFEWYIERMTSIGSAMLVGVYVLMFIIGSVAIILIGFTRNHVLRLSFAVLLAGSAFLVEAYREIVHEAFNYEAFVTMYQSRGFENG